MDRERRGKAFIVCFLLVGLVSQSMVTPVVSRSLEGSTPKDSSLKPDCDCPTPTGGKPTPSHHGSGGGHSTPTPSHGSGGYHSTPPSHGSYYPPSAPIPVIPTPTTPIISTPPSAPVISTPPSDPKVPPFFPGTCYYWSTHPDAIWAIFGYMGTMGQSFGAGSIAAYGKNLNLHDALANPRTDGIGALYREGTAALLNSIACKKFPFTAQQVKDAFGAAIGSDKAAAAQAELFNQANEGKLKF